MDIPYTDEVNAPLSLELETHHTSFSSFLADTEVPVPKVKK